MEKVEHCHDCGEKFEKLATHWNLSSCDYPFITPEMEEIAKGLVLGDGYVNRTNETPFLKCEMVTPEFLEWLHSRFARISLGVTKEYTGQEQAERMDNESGEYQDVYYWATRCHPFLEEYAAWYDSGEKRFPDSLSLSPLSAKVWFCGDGTMTHCRNNRRGQASISCANEQHREEFLIGLFEEHGFSPVVNLHKISFTVSETPEFLEWMGSPLPGFEYKWKYDRATEVQQ